MLLRWLPPGLWMTLIFCASTDVGSSKNTSRIIGPLLRWIFGTISDETVGTIQFCIRKTGHAVGYAILAILCWRAVANPVAWVREAWQKRPAQIAWGIATLYAVTDEIHQSFYPSRGASAADVLLDSIGAALGLLLVRAICLRRKSHLPASS